MQFRLITLLFVFALLAAGMATFGAPGIAYSCLVLLAWREAFLPRRTSFTFWLVLAISMVILIGLLLPAVETSREASRRNSCQNNLKEVAFLVILHQECKHTLPQASAGQPPHSWRLSVTWYMHQCTIASRYKEQLPYDDPANAAVAGLRIYDYLCPSDPTPKINAPLTNYFAITGADTAWANEKLSDIHDPHDQTILILEAAGLDIPWAEPRDLSVQQALDILTGQTPTAVVHTHYDQPQFFHTSFRKDKPGVNVAFCDGSVRFLPVPLDEKLARALLTANGGEEIDVRELDRLTKPQLDYARIYSLTLFLLLALLPGYALWSRRKQTEMNNTQ